MKIVKKKIRKIPRGNCPVCKKETILDYKDSEALEKFTSERGRILLRSRSSLCAKHQRVLSTQIKRARFLGLLPFVVKV